MAELLPAFDEAPPMQVIEEPMRLGARGHDEEKSPRLHEDRGSLSHFRLPGHARYGVRRGDQEVDARGRKNVEKPDFRWSRARHARLPAECLQVAPRDFQLQGIAAREADARDGPCMAPQEIRRDMALTGIPNKKLTLHRLDAKRVKGKGEGITEGVEIRQRPGGFYLV